MDIFPQTDACSFKENISIKAAAIVEATETIWLQNMYIVAGYDFEKRVY